MNPMDELNRKISDIKRRAGRSKDTRRYVSQWIEKDVYSKNVEDAFVMILRTSGCSWAQGSGCSMCGYINDASQEKVREEDLLFQFESAMENYNGEKIVKIFTSGSFLDEDEVPRPVQDRILAHLSEKAKNIIIESRPEFIRSERLEGKKNLEVAIGLESASDFVLEHSVNKGFRFEDYQNAVAILKENDVKVKTYLLLKPPFLSEKDAISDAVRSAEKIAKYSQTISFNPVNIQKFTMVERLWRNGEYRPPWLWSVVEVLKRSSEIDNVRLMSSPTAGGTRRGAHNCGVCDPKVLKGIEEFSLVQDPSCLKEIDCGCRDLWRDILATENIAKSQGDLLKLV
jgi:radical SAM enzyme (TIGR01210 family)